MAGTNGDEEHSIPPVGLQYAWFALITLGQLVLFALLTSFAFSESLRKRRLPSVMNLLFVLFLETFVHLLLFYTGEFRNSSPPEAVCFFQTVIKRGLDAALVSGVCILSLETALLSRLRILGYRNPIARFQTQIAFIVPLAHFLIWSIATAIVTRNVGTIRRPNAIFCTTPSTALSKSQAIEFLILTLITLVSQIYLAVFLYRHWRVIRSHVSRFSTSRGSVSSGGTGGGGGGLMSGIELSIILRIFAITFFEIISVLFSGGITSNKTYDSAWFISLIPLVFAVVFATQMDILRLWFGSCTRSNNRKTEKMLESSNGDWHQLGSTGTGTGTGSSGSVTIDVSDTQIASKK